MSLVAMVEGILEGKAADHALVRIGGGITLQIFVPSVDLGGLTEGDRVKLHTYLIVREDDLQLYGFATPQGKWLFQKLLDVSGVGPKVAGALLSVLSPHVAATAIMASDYATLTRAPGIGKRTAERIVVELKDKLDDMFAAVPALAGQPAASHGADDAVPALMALGYTAFEARQALSQEKDTGSLSTPERIRRALQRMGR